MPPVHLALVWHQHQPVYADPDTGRPVLPWARLHAIKDYWGMARLIERAGVPTTVNLVPSLLDQLEAMAEGRYDDPYLLLGRRPADSLDEAAALFILDNFFPRRHETMVAPVERYAELYSVRSSGRRSAREALGLFGEGDLRDLQVLFELAWFHPVLREEDAVVGELWRKGRDFTEEDKRALFEREREIIRDVIPMHRMLADEGIVELTSTPYHHPILPLLVDFRSLNEALPGAPLPDGWRSLADDARIQTEWALDSHERRFGSRPRGMWPAEGAVSSEAAGLLAELGVEWIASDEMVLERSLDLRFGGNVERSELLYAPWEFRTDGGRAVRIIFRDRALSDLVGFGYSTWDDGARAAEDLVSRLRAVGDTWTGSAPPVVSIILDGENAWENYRDQGVAFLEALYERVVADEGVLPGRVSDILAEVPARRLPRLFAGSWIDGSFGVWAGHEEDRAAWEEVFSCREALDRKGLPPEHPAREALRVAEGSDWFWWYGDDFASEDLGEFDGLFRANLRAAWRLAGLECPSALGSPLTPRARGRPAGPAAGSSPPPERATADRSSRDEGDADPPMPLAREGPRGYAVDAMPELRKDPVLGRWVIVACERAARPRDFIDRARPRKPGDSAFCPFCEGNESTTPPEIMACREPGTRRDGPGWRVRVVPNKFPALRIEGDLGKKGVGVYDRMNGIGAHEVVIESPMHVESLTALDDDAVREAFLACRDRLADLRNDPRMVCGMIFKNVGERAGASLEHTHTQIIVTPVVPRTVMQEMEGCKRFFDYRGRCLFCDMVEQEETEGTRIVAASDGFVAFAPYASRFPFETWIVPKRHASHFEDLRDDGEAGALAGLVKDVLARIETTLSDPPYNYMVHSTPLSQPRVEHYHWHIEVIPRLTRVAGFEWGTGFYINPVPPESAAGLLREADS